MRTGAIFARGSCRALKWMALFGMVFALGAGAALAQITVTGPATNTVTEGMDAVYNVTVKGFIPAGATGETVTVTLATPAPDDADPTMGGEAADIAEANSNLVYTVAVPANAGTAKVAFNKSGVIRVRTTHDSDAEDEKFTLTFTATAVGGLQVGSADTTAGNTPIQLASGSPTALTLNDDEVQEYTLTEDDPGKAKEGTDAIDLTLESKYPLEDSSVILSLSHDGGTDWTLSPISVTVAPATAGTAETDPFSMAVTLTHNDGNDGNRGPDTITLEARGGGSSTPLASLAVMVADIHALPEASAITAVAYDMMTAGNKVTAVDEGGKVYIEVVVDRGADGYPMGEDIKVALALADPSLGTLAAESVTVPRGTGMTKAARVMLTTVAMDSLQAGTLVVNLTASGATAANGSETVMGADPLSLTINNTTTRNVTPKTETEVEAAVAAARDRVDDDDNKWMEGDDDITIPLGNLFNLPTGFTVTSDAGSSMDSVVTASSNAGEVTIMAMGAGSATVTVTVNVDKPTSATVSQNSMDSATVTFSVMVDAEEPREPRALTTDAVIKEISISDVEKRRIGGEERLHLDEGDTVEVTMTVEWSVGQLRDLYDDSTGTPAPVVIEFIAEPKSDPADWLSPLDLSGASQDFRNNAGEITIKIPKMPAETKKDHERVSAKGSDRLNIIEDDDAEDEAFIIDVQNSSMGVSMNPSNSQLVTDTVVIDDDETQGIEVKRTTKGVIYESGADQEFEVSAKPALVDLSLEIDFDLEKSDGSAVPRAYGVSPSSETIAAGQKAMVTVDIDENDGNREDDELELHAQIDSRNRSMDVEDTSVTFEVVDVHKLPKVMVSPKMDSVDEGEEIELTLTIDRNPPDTIRLDPERREHTHEAIDVMLTMGAGTTAGMGDYTLPSKVTFPEHNKKAPWTQEMKVKVMATEDNDLDDGEMLVLDAMVAGTVAANGEEKMSQAAVSSLTIGESTGKLVWARTPEEVEAAVMAAKKDGMGDDMMFTAGEMIELEGNDLFGSAEGVSVGYTAMVEGDAVSESVSGGVVTITADSMGMAKVTITARASRPSGAVMINDQTDPREASITITLEVGLEALSIMLEGPEDENLVEGGMGGMVTATANRAVTEDTMVMLMRDREMSSAGDDDYTAEPITIMAGEMSGSTMVMAVEDNMMETVDNMPEELVLYGMTEGMAGEVTGEVHLHIWDAAVPALPVIAQLLLAALMAVGGYRRYRRR